MQNSRAIILLFIANSISGVAQGISMIAIPWYFEQEQAMQYFGIIYILINLLSLLWVPYSGTFVDQYNRRNIFLGTTLVSGLLLASIGAYGYSQGALSWIWVAIVFMFTFFNYNIHYPNLYAFVQEITEQQHYGRITSYIEIQGQLTSVLAGGAAAMLLVGVPDGAIEVLGWQFQLPFSIKAWSIYEIISMDAMTYFLGFLFILFIRYQPISKRHSETGKLWMRLKVGWDYLRKHRGIFLFGVASHSIFVSVLITTFYLAASYVNQHLEAGGAVFAISELYYAIGAVLAGVAIRRIFKYVDIPISIMIMTALASGLFLLLAVSQHAWIFYAMSLLLGLTNAGTRIQRVTYLFSHVPNQVYGRTTSIFTIINILFRILLLGLFSLPFFHISGNVIYAFALLSLFLFLTFFVLLKNYKSFADY